MNSILDWDHYMAAIFHARLTFRCQSRCIFCRRGSQYFGRNVPRFSGTANSIFGRTIYIFVFTDHQKSISKEIIVQNTNLSNYPVCNASAGNCYKSCLRTLISTILASLKHRAFTWSCRFIIYRVH